MTPNIGNLIALVGKIIPEPIEVSRNVALIYSAEGELIAAQVVDGSRVVLGADNGDPAYMAYVRAVLVSAILTNVTDYEGDILELTRAETFRRSVHARFPKVRDFTAFVKSQIERAGP